VATSFQSNAGMQGVATLRGEAPLDGKLGP